MLSAGADLGLVTDGELAMAYVGLADQRKHRRISMMSDARLEVGDATYPCSILDMSVGGAAIMTPLALAPGSRAVLEIDGMGSFDVRVVRGLGIGLAVSFDVTPERANALGRELNPGLLPGTN